MRTILHLINLHLTFILRIIMKIYSVLNFCTFTTSTDEIAKKNRVACHEQKLRSIKCISYYVEKKINSMKCLRMSFEIYRFQIFAWRIFSFMQMSLPRISFRRNKKKYTFRLLKILKN